MFKIPYSEIEKTFTRNKLIIQGLFRDKGLSADFYGTQVTFSYADRIGIFLANFPEITIKIQSLILQDLNEENIIRKTLISLINKEFGEFDTSQLLRISIAIIISITSKSRIDYPYEIVDINYEQSSRTVKLNLSSLIKFLNSRSIVLLICGLSYVIEELHINETFRYETAEIEEILANLNDIFPSSIWNNEEFAYQFLIRLNFYIEIGNNLKRSYDNLLLYVLKALFFEIGYFHYICTFFAIDTWNIIFTNKKSYLFPSENNSKIFLSLVKPFFPVFSVIDSSGFRIIIGRSRNTGFGTVGINPVVLKLVKFLSIGDQIKLNNPFNLYQVQVVDQIEGPFVKLKSGSCLRINSLEELNKLDSEIIKIISFGDLLLDEFDLPSGFNNKNLGVSHETWVNLAIKKIKMLHSGDIKYFQSLFKTFNNSNNNPITLLELKHFLQTNENLISPFVALELYKKFNIPIHPRWTPKWNTISNREWRLFRKWIINSRYWESNAAQDLNYQIEGGKEEIIQEILSQGQISFLVKGEKIQILDYGIILHYIFLDKSNDLSEIEPAENYFNPQIFLNSSNKIYFEIENNFRVSFSLNSINTFYIDSVKENIHGFYPEPQSEEEIAKILTFAKKIDKNLLLSQINFLKNQIPPKLDKKKSYLLEKTILRAKYNLPIFKDGLIHFSLINSPLSLVKAEEIHLSIDQLHSLGYYYDKDGMLITSASQEIVLKPFDIIVPEMLLPDILNVMKFINDELQLIFSTDPIYKPSEGNKSIIGTNIIGINKNYSVGIYGRIIGFTSQNVLLAPPIWHLSKGSYCNGEMTDTIVMDFDCLLNLDLSLLASKVGMLRGVPIFTQLEPDLDIGSSQLRQLNIEKMTNYFTIGEINSDEGFNNELLIEQLLNNNLYNKMKFRDFITRIDQKFNENELKNIYDPLKQVEIFFRNSSLFGGINEEDLFNNALIYYLNSFLLPEIRLLNQHPVICPKCKNRIEVFTNPVCPFCNAEIDISEPFNTIKNKIDQLHELINNFPYLTLYTFTKEYLDYIELQI